MDLTNFNTISTDEKLAVLKTSAGLQYLEYLLLEGHSLRHIAHLLGIDPKTIYRWRNTYADIAEVVAQYKPPKTVTADPIVYQPRDAAYRIICDYDAHNTIRGYIHSEFETPQDLWNGEYIRNYFNAWGITGDEYYPICLESLKNRRMYRLSNYTLIIYCKISAKGKITPLIVPET